MPNSRIELRSQDQIEVTILRLPRNRPITIVVIHIDGNVVPVFPEKTLGKRLTTHFKSTHPHPLRPRVADDHNVTVLWRDVWAVLKEVIARVWGLKPILAVREVLYS
jgi:hypothetical protein